MSTVIVLERSSRFRGELETEWARQLELPRGRNGESGPEKIRVKAARNTADVLEQTKAGEDGLVVADLDVGQPEVLRLLERSDRRWPVLVVGPAEASGLEWSLRELGAVAVVFDPVNPSYLAGLCRRALGAGRREESEHSQ